MELRECCLQLAVAERLLGSVRAQALIALIADIETLENASELADIHHVDALPDMTDLILIDIGANSVVRLVPVGRKFKRNDENTPLWATVRRLKIVGIDQ